MSLRALLLTGLVLSSILAGGPPANAQNSPATRPQPYQAIIVSANADIRSGPGREYYATQPARDGDIVEVYGEQAGWLAIRPPAGSFSWIHTDDLRREPPTGAAQDFEKAFARRAGVISQIGSRLTSDRDVWQIELRLDEPVFILGHDAADRDWIKVAPPAGEFRWIRDADVRRASAAEIAAARSGTSSVVADSTTNAQPPAEQHASASRIEVNWTARTVADELDKLNFQLSQAVCAAAAADELESLASRAEATLLRAKDQAERTSARELSERINEFLDLAHRQEQLANAKRSLGAAGTGAIARANVRATNSGSTNASGTTAGDSGASSSTAGTTGSAAGEPKFDAVGILTPVSSNNAAAPQYALLDESGRLSFYLTAIPGMRLQAFEGRRVGITGNQGYSPELNARHVTARQVHALDVPLRRE